jgi:DedD protein
VETRVKERLTGAVVLVALIVLLVPALLSGPKREAPRAIATTADEPPVRSYTVDLRDEAHKSAAAVDQSAVQPAVPVPIAAAPAQVAAAAPAAEEPHADAPATASQLPPTGSKGSAATAQGRMQPPVRSRTEPPPQSRTEALAQAASGWAVQLGSFASQANAARLAHELKGKGFMASVSESTGDGRRWYRVRVGPERDRTSAQALAVRLRAAGHAGSVVQGP